MAPNIHFVVFGRLTAVVGSVVMLCARWFGLSSEGGLRCEDDGKQLITYFMYYFRNSMYMQGYHYTPAQKKADLVTHLMSHYPSVLI